MTIRKKQIEALVEQVLTQNHIAEPPVPVEAVARKNGLQIRFQRLESDLSGFLYCTVKQKVIGVNSFHPKVRQRFTIAHELGHFLLHQNDILRVDRIVYARLRSTLSSQGSDPEEVEANLFAAEFLMPRNALARDLAQIDTVDVLDETLIVDLARRYHVSTQALLLRLTNLGYVEG